MPNRASFSINTTFDSVFESDVKTVQKVVQPVQLSYVCMDDLELKESEFMILLDSLLPHEREKILKNRLDQDRKRSLFSILLQRKTIREKLLCSDEDFEIMRTAEAKPFAVSKKRDVDNWNYNVSHHGPFVGIVSHEDYIVGTDIVQLRVRSSWTKGAISYIDMFQAQFTPGESRAAKRCATDAERYKYFFVNWSMKEAYIKAVGRGLGMDLQSLHFMISFDANCNQGQCRGSAKLFVRGSLMTDWSFQFQELDCNHVITIAKGPMDHVSQSYASGASLKFSQPKCSEDSPREVNGLADLTPVSLSKQIHVEVGVKKMYLDDLFDGNNPLHG